MDDLLGDLRFWCAFLVDVLDFFLVDVLDFFLVDVLDCFFALDCLRRCLLTFVCANDTFLSTPPPFISRDRELIAHSQIFIGVTR